MRVLQALHSMLRNLLNADHGQDLVEYGLAVSLIALALISGMDKVANALVGAFTNISTTITPAPARHDYDYVLPDPFHPLPGLNETSPGYLLAAAEPAAQPFASSIDHHAPALGQSTGPVAAHS